MADTFKIALLREGSTRMTCAEANCQQRAKGWLTMADEATVQGQMIAHYIRNDSGRGFVSYTAEEARAKFAGEGLTFVDGATVFHFAPGQTCFQQHLDREVVFAHNRRVHARPQDFVEDFNETAQRAAETARKG